jgi:hypothetical protein
MVFRFTSRLRCGMSVAWFAACLTTGSALAQCVGSCSAVEWSNGQVINLGPGEALGINAAGQVVGSNGFSATEWSNGQVINLWGPGEAYSINAAGQVVGSNGFSATEWSNGQAVHLANLPGATFTDSYGFGINDAWAGGGI